MIWQNPWAWLGIATLALPVLIHLLGRGHARVVPFPSLRFVERSRLLPTRRTRIHDLILLLVRLGFLLAAVAALAQPLLLTRERTQAVRRTVARVVVLDTSASMRVVADSARREASRLVAEAETGIVVETAQPHDVLEGAAQWLAGHQGRHEIVIVSDFQAGSMAAPSLPPTVGVRFTRISGTPPSPATRAISDAGETTARATFDSMRTSVEWTRGAGTVSTSGLTLVSSSNTGAAIRAAASAGARLPFDSTHAITIVFSDAERRDELLRTAKPISEPWMTNVVAKLRGDSLVLAAARSVASATSHDSTGLAVARGVERQAVVIAKQNDNELVLFVDAAPTTILGAAFVASVNAARSLAPPLEELDPAIISDATLASWKREPSEVPRPASNGESDARWLWIVILVLLGVETVMRRVRREAAANPPQVQSRAA